MSGAAASTSSRTPRGPFSREVDHAGFESYLANRYVLRRRPRALPNSAQTALGPLDPIPASQFRHPIAAGGGSRPERLTHEDRGAVQALGLPALSGPCACDYALLQSSKGEVERGRRWRNRHPRNMANALHAILSVTKTIARVTPAPRGGREDDEWKTRQAPRSNDRDREIAT